MATLPQDAQTFLKSYQMISEEGSIESKYLYLEGSPRQYRFDAKEGRFKIYEEVLPSRELTFQPIAWRIFSADILGMGQKNWIEIFFVDKEDCVSSILFHEYSLQTFKNAIEPLYYKRKKINEMVFTVSPVQKESKSVQANGAKYFVAEFHMQPAEAAKVEEYKELVSDISLYRNDTISGTSQVSYSFGYMLKEPIALEEPKQLGAPSETAA